MLNLNSIMIGSSDSKALGAFYKKILDIKPSWEDGDWVSFQVGSSTLSIGAHDQVKGTNKEPGRIIFNFETKEVQREFDRIKALGATVVKEPYNPMGEGDALIATFSDPDGNYFQLATPWNE